MYRVTITD